MPMIRVDRPDCEKAYAFDTATCGDPECGLHIVRSGAMGSQSAKLLSGAISCAKCWR